MSIEHRAVPRTATSLEAVVSMNGDMFVCYLKDISTSGAKVQGELPLVAGAKVSLRLDPFGSVKGTVAWCAKDAAGIKFDDRTEVIEQVLLGLASYAMV